MEDKENVSVLKLLEISISRVLAKRKKLGSIGEFHVEHDLVVKKRKGGTK